MTYFPESELIINPDGSIYHLNLRPEQIASTIITVGDPDRVGRISKYFDSIEVKVSKREFVTHTGWLGGKRLTVISSGIGPDNIDVVINELDALVNIDFETRQLREERVRLNIIRMGTSGCIQPEIAVDSIVVSAFGIGLDNLLHFYEFQPNLAEAGLFDDLANFQDYAGTLPVIPYICECSSFLLGTLAADFQTGITLTSPGFYAPQGRQLRGKSRLSMEYIRKLSQFEFNGLRITNFEMETAAIYGLSRILGHRAISTNAILANRLNGEFSKDPKAAVENLIQRMLERISEENI